MIRPVFAHLPLLVNEQRKKLSKRRDDVSVAEFRAAGYLGEAMRNYLALLGWGPRDGVEIRPIEEMVEQFALEDVSPSSAFFDVKKLQHINAHYIRELSPEEFLRRMDEFLPPGEGPRAALAEIGPLVQERVRTLAEVPDMIRFLWDPEFALPDDVASGLRDDEQAQSMLRATRERLATAPWDPDGVEAAVRDAARAAGFVNAEGEVRLSKAQAPVRMALTGSRVGVPLWQGITALGRDTTLARHRRRVRARRRLSDALGCPESKIRGQPAAPARACRAPAGAHVPPVCEPPAVSRQARPDGRRRAHEFPTRDTRIRAHASCRRPRAQCGRDQP